MPELLIDRLAEVLLEVGRLRETCMVRISTGRGLRAAFFEEGDLVYLASDDPSERLVDFLCEPGRLDDEVSRAMLVTLERSNRSVVAQMLEAHVCTPEQLRPWLVEYAHMCFGRAFDDREGTVKVMPKARAQHPVPFKVSAAALALESVRRMTDEELLRETVGPLEWLVEPGADYMDRLMQVPVNYQEGVLGSQLTGRMRLSELVSLSGLPEDDALRAVLALRIAGVIPPPQEQRALTDSGRLRLREAAMATGVAVDTEAAAIALGLVRTESIDERLESDGALSMDEFEGRAAPRAAPSFASAAPPPPAGGPPRRRGNTGQLRLLASAYVQMAEAEAQSGNFNGAVRYYETALGQKPGDLTVILPFARYLLSLKRPQATEAAERLLKQGCVANPTAVEPRVELVRVYRATGRHAQALEVLAEAERVDPRHPEVLALADGPSRGGGLLSRMRGSRG